MFLAIGVVLIFVLQIKICYIEREFFAILGSFILSIDILYYVSVKKKKKKKKDITWNDKIRPTVWGHYVKFCIFLRNSLSNDFLPRQDVSYVFANNFGIDRAENLQFTCLATEAAPPPPPFIRHSHHVKLMSRQKELPPLSVMKPERD